METQPRSTAYFFQLEREAGRQKAERQWRPGVSLRICPISQMKREERKPKGNGDKASPIRRLPISRQAKREDRKPKGNGDRMTVQDTQRHPRPEAGRQKAERQWR